MPPTYIDPAGDTGSAALPCIDIRDLTGGDYGVALELVSTGRRTWIHRRHGSRTAWSSMTIATASRTGATGSTTCPATAGDEAGHHREWRTISTPVEPSGRWIGLGQGEQTFLGHRLPGRSLGSRDDRRIAGHGARFYFGNVSDTTGGTKTRGVKVDFPFYTWASVIVDGRVVATDYAPDAGWQPPSPGATPGGTYVEDVGPFRLSMSVPPGWTNEYGWMSDGDREDDGASGLEFLIIDEPPKTNCDGSGGTPEVDVGHSVDDLVTFLEGLQTTNSKTDVALKISENTDVTVDGYHGRYLEYTTTVREDDCGLPVWPATTHQKGNQGSPRRGSSTSMVFAS